MGATDERLANQYLNLLVNHGLVAPGMPLSLLDFGAGYGLAASHFRSQGIEVVAIEPFAYGHCEALGLEVYHDLSEFIDAKGASGHIDGVLMLEVIEHLLQPSEVLAALRSLLKPDGWLFASTPNANGLKARLLGQKWSEAKKPGHVVLYTSEALTRLVQSAGFDAVEFSRHAIRFSNNPLRSGVQWFLQKLNLGGNLKLIARVN